MTQAMNQPEARDYRAGRAAARRDHALGSKFSVPYNASPDYREGYEDQWLSGMPLFWGSDWERFHR